MKPLSRDIVVTLSCKIVLLILLWWVCVRGMHPQLLSGQEWMLGKQLPKASQSNNNVR
ncbi:MAG: cytochrome oxidase putative small subunit CydP [Legionella sp.]